MYLIQEYDLFADVLGKIDESNYSTKLLKITDQIWI
jgi:hypothetical protein